MTRDETPTDRLIAERERTINARDLDAFAAQSYPRGVVDIETIEVGLVAAGTRRLLAEHLAADATADLRAWIAQAARAGVGPVRIAQLSGVSRQTVYAVLRD